MGGHFLVLDGVDGSGKSTLAGGLVRHLREARGLDPEHVRDPGGTALGEEVRKILLTPARSPMGGMAPRAEVLLYMASRAQLVEERIRPALRAGRPVVCERFVSATLAYQGHGLGFPLEEIRRLGVLATAGIEPDLTVILDLPAEAGLARRGGAGDRIESRGPDYLRKVRAGFLAEARSLGERAAVVDASRPLESVAADVRSATEAALRRPPRNR
ncbi:MAG: dTMP kinase [Planctomycetales bacterium]|nr:dTMP kinase [Planctomycetales bacterium]